MTVREPTLTKNSETEMRYHYSFSPPSPSPVMKRVGCPFLAGATEGIFEKCV